MNELKYDYLLPIGSVVSVKGSKQKMMLYGILQECTAPSAHTFDYAAVPYPEGLHDSSLIIGIDHSDIESVIFRGYEDDERRAFLLLLEAAERKWEKQGRI
jgi:hypothetical protein